MADVIKRLHYFNGLFLREPDLTAEQSYHLQHQRDHMRLLHTPGIAEGLDIAPPPADATGVTVNAGTAFDDQGRRIVLANNKTVELQSFGSGQPVYITVAYREAQTDPTDEGGVTTNPNTRWTEDPLVEPVTTAPTNPNQKLVLARIQRTGTVVSGVDRSERRASGVKGGDLEVRSLTLTSDAVAPSGWVKTQLGASGQADVVGNMHVTGNLTVTGTITGDIAVGTVQTGDIQDGAVSITKLASNSVDAAKIVDGSVGTNELANLAVTTAKLADGAVTLQKLAPAVQPIVSVDGVSSPGGNVDLIPAGAITITPDVANRRITIGETHSARTDNPHATTAAQVQALALAGGTLAGNLVVNANLGVNTVPAHRLHIVGGDEADNQTFGVVSEVITGAAATNTTALSGSASSSGNGPVQGLTATVTGTGTGNKLGIISNVSGEGSKFAGLFSASTTTTTSSAVTQALSAGATTAGTGPAIGLSVSAGGDSTGQKTGISCFASGADGGKSAGEFTASTSGNTSSSFTRALFATASTAGTGSVTGIVANASGATTGLAQAISASANTSGTGGVQAISVGASGDGTGQKTGITCSVFGADGGKAGGQFFVSTNGTTSTAFTQAITASASTAGTGSVQGLSVGASSTSTGSVEGLSISASGAGTGQKTGITCNVTGNDGNKFGGQFFASTSLATSTAFTRALSATASTAGTGSVEGLSVGASGDGTGQKVGLTCQATGADGFKLAGNFVANTSLAASTVQTQALSASAFTAGNGSAIGINVSASSSGTGQATAIFASAGGSGSGGKFAGIFSGTVQVQGTLTTTGPKPFYIDHPLDPYRKTLRHNAVESPEELCLYRGVVALDHNGKGTVKMPDYFAALTKEEEATVSLTAIGKQPFAASYEWNKKFTAFTVFGKPDAEVSYIVLAIRDDPAVLLLRRPVEEDKSEQDRGKLLSPEAYGAPPEKGVTPIAAPPELPPPAAAEEAASAEAQAEMLREHEQRVAEHQRMLEDQAAEHQRRVEDDAGEHRRMVEERAEEHARAVESHAEIDERRREKEAAARRAALGT